MSKTHIVCAAVFDYEFSREQNYARICSTLREGRLSVPVEYNPAKNHTVDYTLV
jgi:hypothetical protein